MNWSETTLRQLDQIAAAGQSIDEKTEEGPYHALSLPLADLKNELREQIQASTATETQRIINALKGDRSLPSSDMELIRLWIVGDAEHYVRMENDFPAWITELNRLLGALGSLRRGACSPATMSRMAALVEDALRVIADLAFFKAEQARVETFEKAVERLTADDKQIIAGILVRKLASPRD